MKDRATLQWLKDNAIAIHESAEDPNGWIQKHGIRDLPSVDVRSSDGRMLERIIGNVTPAELLNRLQGAQRAQNTTEEPTGLGGPKTRSAGSRMRTTSWPAAPPPTKRRKPSSGASTTAKPRCRAFLESKPLHHPAAPDPTRFSKEVETTLRLHRDRLHDRVTSGEGTVLRRHALALPMGSIHARPR
ncbi:MAG: hypothetical protein R3E96_05245 [Planctomycetota bacterium]